MKKYRFVLALLCVSFLFVLMPATAKAYLWEKPLDLNPGDTFRWVFVTSELTDATSEDIGYYNTFVDTVADAADGPITYLAGIDNWADIQWRAIGSTPTTSAFYNIGTTTSNIYEPYGNLIAYGTDDMWDWAIMSGIAVDEQGIPKDTAVWTGTQANGTGWEQLGETDPTYGYSLAYDVSWIRSSLLGTYHCTNALPMYAISEELTVVPVPGALILAATGMLSATVGLKRLRRKDQE